MTIYLFQDLDRLAAHLHRMGAEEREAKAVIVEDDEEEEEEEEDEEEIHRDGTLPASEPARPLWAFLLLILSRRTCCRVSFPPWRGLHAANNRCRRSYFDTFQFYFTSSWRMVGV